VDYFGPPRCAPCRARSQRTPRPCRYKLPLRISECGGQGATAPESSIRPAGVCRRSLGKVFFADPGSGFVHNSNRAARRCFLSSFASIMLSGSLSIAAGRHLPSLTLERGNILIFFPDGSFLRSDANSARSAFFGAARASALTTMGIYMFPIPQVRAS